MPRNGFCLSPLVAGIDDYIGEKRLQTVNSENDNTSCIRQTSYRHSYAPKDDIDMVVVCVQWMDENRLNDPFSYDEPGIVPAPAVLGETAILYLPWHSLLETFHVKKHGSPCAWSHDTVDAVAVFEGVSAAPIRGEDHPAEEEVAVVNVKAAADTNEIK